MQQKVLKKKPNDKKGGGKRTHPGGGGDGAVAEKKRKNREEEHGGDGTHERGRKNPGEQEGGGGGKARLDALSVGYFRRVGDRLSQGFKEDEERVIFVENVLAEVKGKARLVAMDRTGSITLQRLLPLAEPAQVGALLAELGGEAALELQTVSCDRCGGHVVESALRQMSRCEESAGEEESGEESALEAQVLSLSRVVRENAAEFVKHTHGSHIVRTLLQVLAGCVGPPRADTRPASKDRNAAPQLTDYEAPTSFWYELRSLTDSLMSIVNVSITDTVASAVFQSMLTVCHRKRPKLCNKLLKGVVEYLSTRSAAPGTSPLLVFLKDQASSRLVEVVLQLSPKALLRDVYRSHLRGHLVDLALHPVANFPVQRLVAAAAKLKTFPRLFDELIKGLEAILAAGHMGVIVQMADSCAQSGEKQVEMMQQLLAAFHCANPGTRHVSCLPLFMSLLTYEVYYQTETAEGAVQTEVPLSSICYHGSRLVQALSGFKERSLLMNSLRSLTPADLLTLATDAAGSHVLQALVTTASDKSRGKILRRLEGQLVQIACSRLGSRLLEATWNSASVSHRESIAQELVPSEARLRSDQFARHVWNKFALSHFTSRRARWQEIQSGEAKKRKLFHDILE